MFQISTDGVRSASYSIRDGSNQLNRKYHEIDDVMHMIRGLSGMNQVLTTLSRLQSNVRTEARQEEVLYETIRMIVSKYDECEDEIIENMGNGKFGFEVTSPRVSLFRSGNVNVNRVDTKVLQELLELFN